MPTPFALSPAQRKEAARMYLEEFQSARQIAAHFGISTTATRNALKAEGVTFRDKLDARVLREDFPCHRYPNGRPKPEEVIYRPVNSVFALGSQA